MRALILCPMLAGCEVAVKQKTGSFIKQAHRRKLAAATRDLTKRQKCACVGYLRGGVTKAYASTDQVLATL
jgi:hypothetical protein